MNAAVNPTPAVDDAIRSVRHVRTGVEAPLRACLGADLAAVAEQGPDVLRTRGVARVVLLCVPLRSAPVLVHLCAPLAATNLVDVVDEREHGPRVPVDDEGAVELVGADGRLLDGDGRVRLAELRRRPEVAQVLAPEDVESAGGEVVGIRSRRGESRGQRRQEQAGRTEQEGPHSGYFVTRHGVQTIAKWRPDEWKRRPGHAKDLDDCRPLP